jgi:hypothetical protein
MAILCWAAKNSLRGTVTKFGRISARTRALPLLRLPLLRLPLLRLPLLRLPQLF